jgi:hypothetical protein
MELGARIVQNAIIGNEIGANISYKSMILNNKNFIITKKEN